MKAKIGTNLNAASAFNRTCRMKKAVFVLVLGCLLSAHAQEDNADEGAADPPPPAAQKTGWQKKCAELCAHSNTVKDVALEKACETYRYILPRPTVYRICKTSFDTASREHCPGACGVADAKDHLHEGAEHCGQHRETVPKPDAHAACVSGYRGGDKAAKEFARTIKTLHEEL